MSMTDPIADFLARIRNAILARHVEVVAPASKLKSRICDLLESEGYIAGHNVREGGGFPEINIERLEKPKGMNITFNTTAANDEQGRALLRHLGMPFRN